jgi:Beta protein
MMNIAPDTYVPSLRWRMGEYQALFRLSDKAKARVVPFVVVPEIEFDFDEWVPKKTLQEHVEPLPKRFNDKWGLRPAWIDVHPKICTQVMDDGRPPIAYVFDELRSLGSNAVPVSSLDSTPAINGAIAAVAKIDGRGVGIRARIEHIMKPDCKIAIDALMKKIGVGLEQADLIVD